MATIRAPEVVEGKEITIGFDASRCIHSRFCVLQAPEVFLANVEGPWILPDSVDAAYLASVARNCPSGAISYDAKDTSFNEKPPTVNTIRLRENGPYAVNAELRINDDEALRRTLCRCGASKHKPYCDGSHLEIGFIASGEPPSDESWTLKARHGQVEITPLPNGPLEVRGPIELVSGTGRTIAKTGHCLLCRCGGSEAKPFCDGTHSRIGFCDQEDTAATDAIAEAMPSLAEWLGGRDVLRRLTERFYAKVTDDPILESVFAGIDAHHARHVADFLTEVLGGGEAYTKDGGSHVGMIMRHLHRNITEEQRARWVARMIETANEIGMPSDAAFSEAFAAYLDWGSRLAVINSADGVPPPDAPMPMPRWGWGPTKKPDHQ